MPEKDEKYGDVLPTNWVAYADQIPPLIKALLAHGFQKLEPSAESKKIWGDDYLWYSNGKGDVITIDEAKRKGERIITITEGCKPIISDTFAGLDCFRVAQEWDF